MSLWSPGHECPPYSRSGFLSGGTVDILGEIALHGLSSACFVGWSAASLPSTQWHLPQFWQLKTSLDIVKCPPGAKLSPVENHCSRGLFWELMGKIARQDTWMDIQFRSEFRWDKSLGGLFKYPPSATLPGILEDSLCSWQGILVVQFILVKPGSRYRWIR